MKKQFYSLFDNHLLAGLCNKMEGELGLLVFKRFPDGESYLRIESNVKDKDIILVDSLDRPDDKLVPILLFAKALRDMGAASIGLIAPYLGYMRQDTQFAPGEVVTSKYFAQMISEHVDWIVTTDPHLHRYETLSEIYSVKNSVVQSAQTIAAWIKTLEKEAILIGPDSESQQWVSRVAHYSKLPYVILNKVRHSATDVEIAFTEEEKMQDKTPIILDDIISTGTTMIETMRHLQTTACKPPICVGVHAVFTPGAYESLLEAGAQQVVTCNTISHKTNQIDITDAIVEVCSELSGT